MNKFALCVSATLYLCIASLLVKLYKEKGDISYNKIYKVTENDSLLLSLLNLFFLYLHMQNCFGKGLSA